MNHLRLVPDEQPATEAEEWAHLARILTRFRLHHPGDTTDITLTAGEDPVDVAFMLHDWLDGYRIQIVSTTHLRVIKL